MEPRPPHTEEDLTNDQTDNNEKETVETIAAASNTPLSDEKQKNLENRKEKAKEGILKVLSNMSKMSIPRAADVENQMIDDYIQWLKESLYTGMVLDTDNLQNNRSLDFTYFEMEGGTLKKSGSKDGSYLHCRHVPTNIVVETSADKPKNINESVALDKMSKALKRHLNDWKIYLSPRKGFSPTNAEIESVTPDLILELMIEAEDVPEIVPENQGRQMPTEAAALEKESNADNGEVVPFPVPEEWRGELGHKAEDMYLSIITRLGVTEVPYNKVGQHFDYEAITRPPATIDFRDKLDFQFYNPIYREWIKIDLSTATNPENLSEKRQKERETGIRLLRLDYAIIHRAYLGSERDIEIVATATRNLVMEREEDIRGERWIPTAVQE
jgi:hypothetical protein